MNPTFSPAQNGTPESTWLASRLAETDVVSPPTAADIVVVVGAHPDDESLGAGGLISTATANGAVVRIVVATAGEASHPGSTTHDMAKLSRLRRTELANAATALGAHAEPIFLGLADGALAQQRAQLRDKLAVVLADATIVATPWADDGHPDHEACAAAVTDVLAERSDCAHWQYPIWAWHWGAPDDNTLPWREVRRLELSDGARAAKQAAIAAHRSQHLPLSPVPGDEAILPPHVLSHFDRGFEAFVVAPRHPAARADYFDALYATSADPWGLANRFYEQRKRELLFASLPRRRFARAFEPGCATGEITARLAQRCDEVVAWDGAGAAVEATRERLGMLGHIRVAQARIPQQWPTGRFDLIVLSEVGYYCTDLGALRHRVQESLDDGGVVAACHWRRAAPDHPQTAEGVHAELASGLRTLVHHDEGDFVLHVWSRDGRSVAQREGIVS